MNSIKIFISAKQDRKIVDTIKAKGFGIELASSTIEQSASKIEKCDALVF